MSVHLYRFLSVKVYVCETANVCLFRSIDGADYSGNGTWKAGRKWEIGSSTVESG